MSLWLDVKSKQGRKRKQIRNKGDKDIDIESEREKEKETYCDDGNTNYYKKGYLVYNDTEGVQLKKIMCI